MRLLLLGCALLICSGCATILNDDYQQVNITTSSGKKVSGTIDGIPFEAPGIVPIKRSDEDRIIIVNDPKCSPRTIANKKVDPKFFINVLSGGVLGSTTDYVSEKMWQYDDNLMIACSN